MKIAVKDLHHNPHRDMARYPINTKKVNALVSSIRATDFWDNLVCRKSPDGKGYQIAYGHHRLEALRKSRIAEVDLPVRNLDDATMLKMLVSENMEEWGASAAIVQESIRAVVLAYAAGQVELDPVNSKTSAHHVRNAPSFIQGCSGAATEHPYTAATIAQFLCDGKTLPEEQSAAGWPEKKVQAFLRLLELEESNLLSASAVNGMNAAGVYELTKNVACYANEPAVARAVAAGLAKSFSAGELSTSSSGRVKIKEEAERLALAVGFKAERVEKAKHKLPPNQDEAAGKLAVKLDSFDPPIFKQITKLAEYADDIKAVNRRALAHACRARAEKWLKLVSVFAARQ